MNEQKKTPAEMLGTEGRYVPALGYDWLTRFYDPLIATLLRERKFKEYLIRQAGLRATHAALDLGCGTGTLTIMLKQSCPEATVVGLDADGTALAIARRKAEEANQDVEFRQGLAFDPPFPEGSFDRILSSLLFHHLDRGQKERTFAAAHRLLRPGGELHVLDWGRASNVIMRLAFLPVQLLDGFASTSDNVRGLLVPLMEQAGFARVEETHDEMTLFGTLSTYRAA